MRKVRVDIYQTSSCAWCEIDGRFIYAKDAEELQQTLDAMSAYNKKQYELAHADSPELAYNH